MTLGNAFTAKARRSLRDAKVLRDEAKRGGAEVAERSAEMTLRNGFTAKAQRRKGAKAQRRKGAKVAKVAKGREGFKG